MTAGKTKIFSVDGEDIQVVDRHCLQKNGSSSQQRQQRLEEWMDENDDQQDDGWFSQTNRQCVIEKPEEPTENSIFLRNIIHMVTRSGNQLDGT